MDDQNARALKCVFPLGDGKEVWIHFFGGEPSAEQFDIIRRHLDVMNKSLNGVSSSASLQPSQPVVVESTVTGDRPRHGKETLHQLAPVRKIKPPCLEHPELGPVARHLITNRCPICDGQRLEKARKEQRFCVVSEQQREFILSSYPDKTQDDIQKETGLTHHAIRTVLLKGGFQLGTKPGRSRARDLQNRMVRQI